MQSVFIVQPSKTSPSLTPSADHNLMDLNYPLQMERYLLVGQASIMAWGRTLGRSPYSKVRHMTSFETIKLFVRFYYL